MKAFEHAMRREPGVANHPRRIPPKIEKPTTFGCCWPMSETIPSKGARAAMAMKLGSGNSKLHTSESAPTHEVAQGSDTDCVTPGLSGILACGYVSPDRTAFFADLWSRARRLCARRALVADCSKMDGQHCRGPDLCLRYLYHSRSDRNSHTHRTHRPRAVR